MIFQNGGYPTDGRTDTTAGVASATLPETRFVGLRVDLVPELISDLGISTVKKLQNRGTRFEVVS